MTDKQREAMLDAVEAIINDGVKSERPIDFAYKCFEAGMKYQAAQKPAQHEPVFYTSRGAVDTARALNSTFGVSPVQDEYFSVPLFLGTKPPRAVPDCPFKPGECSTYCKCDNQEDES